MYEKVLEERKIMFFRHCPPIANLDDVSSARPQEPFKEAAGYKCSVFYYWWAFLRENAAYRACCDEHGQGPLQDLYSFFGDVRGDDFVAWWSFGANGRGGGSYAGRDLFCESVLDPITIGPVREGDVSHVQLSVPVIPAVVMCAVCCVIHDVFCMACDVRPVFRVVQCVVCVVLCAMCDV